MEKRYIVIILAAVVIVGGGALVWAQSMPHEAMQEDATMAHDQMASTSDNMMHDDKMMASSSNTMMGGDKGMMDDGVMHQ